MELTTLAGELNLDDLSHQIEQLFPDFSIDFTAFFGQVLAGNMGEAFRGLSSSIRNGILAEIGGMKNLMLTLLIIGVLSADRKSVV